MSPHVAAFFFGLLVVGAQALGFPFPPPTAYFPALYFGANATGPESADWLAFVRRHALAGYGWQHKTQVTNFSHIEVSLAQAATRRRRLSRRN